MAAKDDWAKRVAEAKTARNPYARESKEVPPHSPGFQQRLDELSGYRMPLELQSRIRAALLTAAPLSDPKKYTTIGEVSEFDEDAANQRVGSYRATLKKMFKDDGAWQVGVTPVMAGDTVAHWQVTVRFSKEPQPSSQSPGR